MLTKEQVEPRLRKIIAEQLGITKEISGDSNFTKDLGADSLDTVELVMAVEDEFNIEINDEDGEKMACMDDVTTWLTTSMYARNAR